MSELNGSPGLKQTARTPLQLHEIKEAEEESSRGRWNREQREYMHNRHGVTGEGEDRTAEEQCRGNKQEKKTFYSP